LKGSAKSSNGHAPTRRPSARPMPGRCVTCLGAGPHRPFIRPHLAD